MFRIHDPLGLIEKDPELKRRVMFFERVVKPICLFLIVAPMLLFTIVLMVEVIKHG